MSRFLSTKPYRHDLGNGEWIEFKGGLPYHVMDQIIGSLSQTEPMKSSVELLKQAILDWYLLDEQGVALPYSVAAIEELTPETIVELSDVATKLYMPSKKN